MSLFEDPSNIELSEEIVGPGATILRNVAVSEETEILSGLSDVVSKAPFRHMITPGGFRMSVAMTNCGALGWVTDRTGYRYDPMDPESGLPWPPMPESFLTLARNAAAKAGFKEFVPDACLINRYDPGARLTLHQDKNERDFDQPIVSVSLGLPATFLFGGLKRTDTAVRVKLTHGDVAVWADLSKLSSCHFTSCFSIRALHPFLTSPPCSHVLPAVGPLQNRVQCRTQRLTPWRETVFHSGRHFRIGLTDDDAIRLHSAKLLAKHLLRDIRNCALQIGKAQHFATEQMKEYDEFPASFENAKGCFHVLGGRQWRIFFGHTFTLVAYFPVRTCA